MNTLEMKGAFMSLLAEVEDPEVLRQMLESCVKILQQTDPLDDLPMEVLAALEKIELDDDLTDVISNEMVFQQFRTWQKQ